MKSKNICRVRCLMELMDSASIPLPAIFEGDDGKLIYIHPYNWFSCEYDKNQYAYSKKLLIYKFNGKSFITIYTPLFEEVLLKRPEFFEKIKGFDGFSPKHFSPVDSKLKQIWYDIQKKYLGKK